MPMLYRLLSSLKTSLYLLSFMSLIFLIGVIFPQGENIDDYINAGGKYAALVRALDFLDIFMSPLFILATLLLFVNLAVCLFDRFRIFLKIRRVPLKFPALKKHPDVITFNNGDVENRLKKTGFRLKAEALSGQPPRVKIYEKGLQYWWLSWFYHLGIILAIAGFFMTALFAFEKDFLLYPGEPVTISLYSKETRWNKLLGKMGLGISEKNKEDEYLLSLREFRTEYYQGLKLDYPGKKVERLAIGIGIKKLEPSGKEFSYMPKMWLTRLYIKKPDGGVLDAELRVNKPLSTEGLTLYQMGYKQKADIAINGEVMEVEVMVPFEAKDIKGKFVIASLKLGKLFKKDGTTEEITPVTTIYYIPEGDPSARDMLGDIRLGGMLNAKGVILEFRDYKEGSYLSYRKDPGVRLVGIASLFVLLGLFVRSLGAWYRVQYAAEKKIAYLLISTRGILADKERIVRRLRAREKIS